MNSGLKWRLTYGALNLVLVALANRLAYYLTKKLLGQPEEL